MTRVQGSMIHTDEWHKKYMEVWVGQDYKELQKLNRELKSYRNIRVLAWKRMGCF